MTQQRLLAGTLPVGNVLGGTGREAAGGEEQQSVEAAHGYGARMPCVGTILELEVSVFGERCIEKGATRHNLDLPRLAVAESLLVE